MQQGNFNKSKINKLCVISQIKVKDNKKYKIKLWDTAGPKSHFDQEKSGLTKIF